LIGRFEEGAVMLTLYYTRKLRRGFWFALQAVIAIFLCTHEDALS
jgi:hypothetical protein